MYVFREEVLLWNNGDLLVFFMVGDPTVNEAVMTEKWCCEYV